MNIEGEVITVNGIKYFKEGNQPYRSADTMNGMSYVICRTNSTGVFAGYLEKKEGKEIILRAARRIWYWAGAASLSHVRCIRNLSRNMDQFAKGIRQTEVRRA